jgi:2,3,4,5-tetrahydropyridine-2-carboxylate N-succinyltransferase
MQEYQNQYSEIISAAWQRVHDGHALESEHKQAILDVMGMLDKGLVRVASCETGQWLTHIWAKQAILLSFKVYTNTLMPLSMAYDKVPLKFANWTDQDFLASEFRIVPGAVVRHSAYIGKQVVVMPSFINVGAYIGDGSMVDSWVTIGSAAQIGKNCHISMQAGVGGVLEPLQAEPTIIEDGVFIGACAQIAEGIKVGQGAVIAMGTSINASTKIYNRITGELTYGCIPPFSVVVPGSLPDASGKFSTNAAIIMKQVDARTRDKTKLTDLLRYE